MELGLNKIYFCPSCDLETPHYLLVQRKERVGISCMHCQTISLVATEDLEEHQFWWEEELNQILSSLEEDPFDHPD